jgi:tripartite-type tricarboxylate transporter receptor subunit TctC
MKETQTMRILILTAALAACGLAAQMQAHAQVQAQTAADYPSKPIRFVLISAAGSGGDTLGRLLAEKMAPLIKGNFLVDNRPGAGGSIAIDLVAKAPPDGYTITLGGATTHVLLPASNPKLPYNPVKDFAPIGQVGTAAIVMIAANDVPANNLKELVALSKATPGGVQYASGQLLRRADQHQDGREDAAHPVQVCHADPDGHPGWPRQGRVCRHGLGHAHGESGPRQGHHHLHLPLTELAGCGEL